MRYLIFLLFLIININEAVFYRHLVGQRSFNRAEESNFVTSALDSKENLYIAYLAKSENRHASRIRVWTFQNASWKQINTDSLPRGDHAFLNLRIDSNDVLYLSFADNEFDRKASVFSLKDKGDWEVLEKRGVSLGKMRNPDIVISDNNQIYAALNDEKGFAYVARFDKKTNTWLNIGNKVSDYPTTNMSLALLNENSIYLTYTHDKVGGNAAVAHYNGKEWQYLNSGLPKVSADGNKLVFDKKGKLYLVINQYGQGYLSIMYLKNGTWEYLGKALSKGLSVGAKLAFDANNRAYIAYVDGGLDYHVTLRYFEDEDWRLIQGSGYEASYPNLLINQKNELLLSFYDQKADFKGITTINYSDMDSPKSEPLKIPAKFEQKFLGARGFTKSRSFSNQIVLTSKEEPVVAYFDSESKVRVKIFKDNNWQSVAEEAISTDKVTNFSLAIDSNDRIYLAYSDKTAAYSSTVKYFDGKDWQLIGEAGFYKEPVGYLSLAISKDTNTIFLAFQDKANDNRTVLTFYDETKQEWLIYGHERFLSKGSSTDQSLYVFNSGTILLAYKDGQASWKTTVVYFGNQKLSVLGGFGINSPNAHNLKMAMSNSSKLYLAYIDMEKNNSLTVMLFRDGKWQVLGERGFSGGSVSHIDLVVNHDGIPFVVYNSASENYQNSVAYFNGKAWQKIPLSKEVLNLKLVTSNNSLAITKDNKIYTFFQDSRKERFGSVIEFSPNNK